MSANFGTSLATEKKFISSSTLHFIPEDSSLCNYKFPDTFVFVQRIANVAKEKKTPQIQKV